MAGTKYYATVGDKASRPISNGIESALGEANIKRIKESFPAAPIYASDFSEDKVQADHRELVLDGEVEDGNGIQGTFSRDYTQGPTERERAPDVASITEDNAGNKLYSPYVPNPTSPGPGSFEAPEELPLTPAPNPQDRENKQFGTGFSSVYNPVASSEYIENGGVKRPMGKSSLANTI